MAGSLELATLTSASIARAVQHGMRVVRPHLERARGLEMRGTTSLPPLPRDGSTPHLLLYLQRHVLSEQKTESWKGTAIPTSLPHPGGALQLLSSSWTPFAPQPSSTSEPAAAAGCTTTLQPVSPSPPASSRAGRDSRAGLGD